MPLYNFICTNPKCEHTFERIDHIADAPRAKDLVCPECGCDVEQTWEGGRPQWYFKERFR